jgi:pheromone shutdown protein TraB
VSRSRWWVRQCATAAHTQHQRVPTLQVLQELLPKLHAALVAERDVHMADQLQTCAKQLGRTGSLVGVVGLAHLDGLEGTLMQRQLAQVRTA